MAQKISLASAIRTSAHEVTGESINGSQSNYDGNHARSRVNPGLGPSVRQASSINTVTTAPNFYSPFLTPSSFQIPNARREVYLWANWWRNNEPKVSAAISFLTNFPFSGWKLECSSTYVKDYFEKLTNVLNFQKWLPEISKTYYLLGDAFVLLSIDCEHCHGSGWNNNKNEECKHDGATWKSISLLNPDSVLKSPGMIDKEGSYVYRPSAEEVRVVNERQPKELYDSIPDNIKKLIIKGEPIKLNPLSIHHFKHGSNPWEDYGISIVRPLFPILTYKDKLRQAQYIIAERLILPIKVVKIGSNERPASQEDIDNVQDELASLANDPNLTLVTHHNFDLEWYGASGKIHSLQGEFEHIDSEVLDGLMLSKALLGGSDTGISYSNAQVSLLAMHRRLEAFRNEVANWIEQKIFKPVAEWNGFIVEGDRGQDEIVYPKIKFDDLQLKDDSQKLQVMATANQQGVISNVSLIEAFGLDVDQEIERLRFEQGAAFMKDASFGVPSFSMNLQSGPVTGQGFAAQLGTTPTTPGMPPMDMGMGAPPTGMTPPMASDKNKNYRLAADLINSIYEEKMDEKINNINKRYASTRFKSAAHEGFIQSILPVTGRGMHGPLDVEYKGLDNTLIQLDFGGDFSSPLNFAAQMEHYQFSNSSDENIRLAFKSKIDKKVPTLYTSLEKKLYSLLMSLNIAEPLYAQYSAGPTSDFQLDAAIPTLGIAVEADGEIWHNNFQKMVKDKQRDSELARNGWIVLRFTDKELNDHAQDCVNIIVEVIKRRKGQTDSNKQTL